LDVRLRGADAADLHRQLVLHLGAAAVPVRVRPLGTDTARLVLASPLPVRVGDHGLLRDPGEHRIPAGFDVLDVRPPGLSRRGAARARAAALARPTAARDHLRRRGFVLAAEFTAMGLPETGARIGKWLVDPDRLHDLPAEAVEQVRAWSRQHPVAAGMPVETLRQSLGLPAAELVPAALTKTGLELSGGLVVRPGAELPAAVDRAVREVEARLDEHPFRAPEADELRELGLGVRELAAAVRTGRLTAITDGIVLGPDAEARAVAVLTELSEPFTVSEARRALDSTRRVVVPLLERLDDAGSTEWLGDGRRRVISG
jgi:selenocysteine-specific elongation factor